MFFRLIASLSHTSLCGELLKLTNLNVTSLLSPSSALSQLLRSKRKGSIGGGAGKRVTCVEYVWLFPNFSTPPFHQLRHDQGFVRDPRAGEQKEAESTNFGSGAQLSTLLRWVILTKPLNLSEPQSLHL